MAHINIEIGAELHKRLKKHALDNDVSLKDLIVEFLFDGLKEEE